MAQSISSWGTYFESLILIDPTARQRQRHDLKLSRHLHLTIALTDRPLPQYSVPAQGQQVQVQNSASLSIAPDHLSPLSFLHSRSATMPSDTTNTSSDNPWESEDHPTEMRPPIRSKAKAKVRRGEAFSFPSNVSLLRDLFPYALTAHIHIHTCTHTPKLDSSYFGKNKRTTPLSRFRRKSTSSNNSSPESRAPLTSSRGTRDPSCVSFPGSATIQRGQWTPDTISPAPQRAYCLPCCEVRHARESLQMMCLLSSSLALRCDKTRKIASKYVASSNQQGPSSDPDDAYFYVVQGSPPPVNLSIGTTPSDGVWLNKSDKTGLVMSCLVWVLMTYATLVVIFLGKVSTNRYDPFRSVGILNTPLSLLALLVARLILLSPRISLRASLPSL